MDSSSGYKPNTIRWGKPFSHKRVWQRFLLAFTIGLTFVIRKLPRNIALRLGVSIGRFAYRIAKKQRVYADRNLRLAYGDTLDAKGRAALTRRVFEHLGRILMDFLRCPRLSDPAIYTKMVCAVEGWEEYALPVLRSRKPGIIATGHIGNWELLAQWLALQGVKLTVVARDPEDPAFARYVRQMREGNGLQVASKGNSARLLLAALKRGEWVGITPDQNSGDLFVPFFDVPAGTVAGPATFALRTNAVVLPCFCMMEPDTRYRLIFLPPITAQESDNRDSDTARIMAQVNNALESIVRRYPEQWLWVHNRWKSAFEEQNLSRWPRGYDPATLQARWK